MCCERKKGHIDDDLFGAFFRSFLILDRDRLLYYEIKKKIEQVKIRIYYFVYTVYLKLHTTLQKNNKLNKFESDISTLFSCRKTNTNI